MPSTRRKRTGAEEKAEVRPEADNREGDVAEVAPPKRSLPPALEVLLGVGIDVSVDLGSATMELGDVLNLSKTGLIVLDQAIGEPVVMRLNGVPYARGEVVEMNGRYGIRVVEMLPSQAGLAPGF